mgnify:CR=1 FL=1|tara:strand:- start:647 stop:1114 length:468 start_codon:yes stop_codon:yes gene_type:complete
MNVNEEIKNLSKKLNNIQNEIFSADNINEIKKILSEINQDTLGDLAGEAEELYEYHEYYSKEFIDLNNVNPEIKELLINKNFQDNIFDNDKTKFINKEIVDVLSQITKTKSKEEIIDIIEYAKKIAKHSGRRIITKYNLYKARNTILDKKIAKER